MTSNPSVGSAARTDAAKANTAAVIVKRMMDYKRCLAIGNSKYCDCRNAVCGKNCRFVERMTTRKSVICKRVTGQKA
jgi:hypothetical protein